MGSKPDIGRIDLLPEYTLFDVRKDDAHRVIDALRNVDFFGTTIRPEIATDRDYARDARDRREKRRRKGEKEEYSRSSKSSKGKKEAKSKKETKEKKDKKSKKTQKADYNGNYEIFYKKK